MSIQLAICLTLVASAVLNLAIALFKKSVHELAERGEPRPVLRLFRSKSGFPLVILLLAGYGIFLLAASARAAPISVLRPLFSFGMIVIAVLAVVVLKERFEPLEWLGLVILLIGTVLVGVSAGSGTVPNIHLWRLVVFFGGSALAGLVILGLSTSLRHQRAEFAFGVIVGLFFGCGYLATKTIFLAWQEGRIALALLALAIMAGGMGGGLAVLLSSFRWGRALMIRGVNFVVNQVMVIVGGAYCLGESFPEQPLPLMERLLGFAAIVLGALLLLSAGKKISVGAS